jgi:hypothetical protein
VSQIAGDSAGALENARAALAKLNTVTNDPSRDDTQQELTRIQRSIGEAWRTQGDPARAFAADREAVRIMSELMAKAPAQALWQRELAVSHGKAGLDLLAGGDVPGARSEIRSGLEIMKRLAALDPTNADWQQDLAELHRGNGDAAGAAANDAAAHEEYAACAGIAEPMVSSGSPNKKLGDLSAYCRLHAPSVGNNGNLAAVGQTSTP